MEQLVSILQNRTQNRDPRFFRLMVSYYYAKIASMMRARVKFAGTQNVPINMYAVNLATSGAGKGHSISIMEEQVINVFRERFLSDIFPASADTNIRIIANNRAIRNDTDPEKEFESAWMEFEDMGELLFSFDSATGPALKQMRTKLLFADAGSMNLEIDEIGSNLLGNTEALTVYLELFDLGKVKPKLIKNTRENQRSEDLVGHTPANALLFGTPTKLMDGAKTEEEFYSFLETGYARRCFFGLSRHRQTPSKQTAQDLYDTYNDVAAGQTLLKMSSQMATLANRANFNSVLEMDEPVSLELMEYRIHCQERASRFPEHKEVERAEMVHRYFKAAKLAGAYAFIENKKDIEMSHLENAIAMSEMSGEAFEQILTRDRPHVKLANYIAATEGELTNADLIEDLPYYKGSKQHLEQMMSLATAYGYREGIYIKREEIDGITFFSGNKVPETDLNAVKIAYSTDIAQGYQAQEAPFSDLHKLTQMPGYHWITHAVNGGHRKEDAVIPGCNLVVLDVDGEISLDMVRLLLDEYTYHIYTTKRHTEQENRFRIVLPLSHYVSLDAQEFKAFMSNIFDWLPFEVDRATGQRARKWLSHKGNYWYNDGELLDTLQFVPKTKKAEEQRNRLNEQSNLTHLERWYVNMSPEKGRNNQLMRYAYALLDTGKNMVEINDAVLRLNGKFSEPLPEAEVLSSVLATATKEFAKRSSQ
jgi:hypothetical protein